MEERILALLGDINEELTTYTGPNMMEDDLIDSFALISLISALEDEFDIEIDAEFVTVENFGNKDRIIALVKKLMGK